MAKCKDKSSGSVKSASVTINGTKKGEGKKIGSKMLKSIMSKY